MHSPPVSLLAAQYASVQASSKAEAPSVYLDVTGAQALLSSQQLPAYRGQSAASGTHGQRCSSPVIQQRRAQTAGCIQSHASAGNIAVSSKTASRGSRGSNSTEQASSSGASAVPYRRPRWDDRVVLPTDPTFAEALQAWQQDVERGVYAPKLLGSITAVSSGRLKTAAGSRRPGSRAKSPLGPSAARPQMYHTTTAITSSSTAPVAAASTSTASASALRCSCSSDSSGVAAVTPVVFQGSGENALQALEGIVIKHLVARPHLTLMQLQRAVQGISQLDSPCQLAAIGELVKAGFWLAAMQVAYTDGLSVLSDVLVEMRAIIDMGLHWENQALAAAAWSWVQVDRDLFLHTFRASDLTAQYLQLRKQLIRLQQLQLVAHQQQQRMQQRSPLTAYNGLGGSTSSVSALKVDCHPDLARAERVLLVNIIDSYLAHIVAAAEAAVADETAAGPLSSRLVGCYAGFESDAAAVRKAGKKGKSPKTSKQRATSSSASPLVQSCSTLQISSDWKIQLEVGEHVDLSDVDGDSSDSSSSSSSSSSRSSDSSDHNRHLQDSKHGAPSPDAVEGGHAAPELQVAACAKAEQPEPQQSATAAAVQELLAQEPQAGTAVPQPPQQQEQQQMDAAVNPPPLPAQPCSRPQSHLASRRCSTAQGSRPGTAQRISSAAGTHQHQQQQQWPPAVGSILAFAGAGGTSHNSSHNNSMGRSYSHSGGSSIGSSSQAEGLPLSPTAAARMRPASAASGLSKLSRPGSSSIETRPRPGSAATGIAASLLLQQQQDEPGCIQESGLEGIHGDAAGLHRFKEACAQHRQDLQNWAEESAVNLDAALPGASEAAADSTTGAAAAGKARLSHASSMAAGTRRPASAVAGRSRPVSAAAGASAAVLSPAPTLPGTRPSTGAAVAAGSSRLSSGGGTSTSSSRPRSSAGAAAVATSTRRTSIAESQGHCSVYSYGGDLLYSSSKGLLSPHDLEPCSRGVSQTGGSTKPIEDSPQGVAPAGCATVSAPGEDIPKERDGEQCRSSAPGRTSPVPHLPLREAGLIAPDQDNFEVKVARTVSADAANAHACSGAGRLKGASKSKAAGKAAGSAAASHSLAAPVKSAKKPAAAAAKSAAGAKAQAASADGQGAGKKGLGLKGSLTSMFASKADNKQTILQQQQVEPQQPPQQAKPLAGSQGQAVFDSTAGPAEAAPCQASSTAVGAAAKGQDTAGAAQAVPAVPGSAVTGPGHDKALLDTSSPAAAEAAVAAIPAQQSSSTQVPLQQQGQHLQQDAEGAAAGSSSSGTPPQQAAAQHVHTGPVPAAEPQAAVLAGMGKDATAVAPATAASEATDKRATPAAMTEAAPPHRPASADRPVHNAEDQLIVELTQTMQQFQQHLQQTALMAQQLLTQQVAGQAAREAGPGSNSNSRPSSAAAHARRLSAASSGSRPGSRGQQRLSAAGSKGQGPLPNNLMGAQSAAGGGASQGPNPGLLQSPGLMLEDVLEADEPPTAEEVQAYAQYLGMDPVEDAALLYLAGEALLAPVPPGWTVHLDAAQNEYFHNTATGVSTYEHPLDEHYRQLYQQKKHESQQS